jgi:uracil-DNA glycosylase
MLKQWSDALPNLYAAVVHKDVPSTPLVPYGEAFVDSDKVDIPSMDLPAGTPGWMYADDGWARRVGTTAAAKRSNITITVADGIIP